MVSACHSGARCCGSHAWCVVVFVRSAIELVGGGICGGTVVFWPHTYVNLMHFHVCVRASIVHGEF